jgi:hypothetical protein
MRAERKLASPWIAGLIAGILCAGCFAAVDSSTAKPSSTAKTHRKAAKKPQLPPLPSGPQGPVPQISLDSIQAVAPHVTYQGGQLTIVAPNSTLADILRAVRKLTGAEVDIPASATERVVTNLGPGPAPGVVAELLNGSHFNYVLLGSASDANALTRVVLVAKGGPDTTPSAPPQQNAVPVANGAPPQPIVAENAPDAPDADAADDNADENAEPSAAEAEQQQQQPQQPAAGDAAVKSPQQLLQEMQERQLQMQQQQQPGGQPMPGAVVPPQRPPQQPPDQQ